MISAKSRIPDYEYRFYYVTNVAYLFGVVSHAVFLSVFLLLNVKVMVLHNVFSCLIFSVALWANRKRFYRLAMALAFSEVLIHATLAVYFVGQASGFQYYIFVMVPLIFFISVVKPWVRFSLVSFAFMVYIFILYFMLREPVYPVEAWVLRLIRGGNIAGAVMGLSFIGYWYGKINQTAEEVLYSERNRLREQNDRLQNDLEMARRIQLQLVPSIGPIPGLAFFYRPMAIIGGDFYDFILFPHRPQEIGIFISDVSGHGVPAALIASMLKSTLLQSSDALGEPPQLLSRLNDILISKTNDNFVTAFYGICDLDSREIRFCNAGHNPPLVLTPETVFELESKRSGYPLGIIENANQPRFGRTYSLERATLAPGSRLLFYTDGLSEARGGEGNEYGDRRLWEVLLRHRHRLASEIVDELARDLSRFNSDKDFADDVCFVCLELGEPDQRLT